MGRRDCLILSGESAGDGKFFFELGKESEYKHRSVILLNFRVKSRRLEEGEGGGGGVEGGSSCIFEGGSGNAGTVRSTDDRE